MDSHLTDREIGMSSRPTGEEMLREAIDMAVKHHFVCATIGVEHLRDVLFELAAIKMQRDHWKAIAMKRKK